MKPSHTFISIEESHVCAFTRERAKFTTPTDGQFDVLVGHA